MSRARVIRTSALCALILLSLAPPRVMALERIELDPTMVLIDVEPQDVEETRAEGDDGSVIVAGHLGARPGCPGVQAYVKKILANGTVDWELTASAGLDCDLDGQPDGGGAPLFADITGLDPAYVVSSTIRDTVYLEDRTSYVTGQILIAWEDFGLKAAWGGFVVRLSPSGAYLADLYVGPQPTGPPAEVASCDALCAALGESTLDHWGGRTLAWFEDGDDSGLVLAGWHRAGANPDADDKNVFLVALDPDLATAKWFQLIPHPGPDLPLDATVVANGDVFATGYYGPDHDVYVARFDGRDGTLTHLFVGGGPRDDWGDRIAIRNGEVEVSGVFDDVATFDETTLVGDGPTEFRLVLTQELELILAEVPGGEESSFRGSDAMTETTERRSAVPLKTETGQTVPPANPGAVVSNPPTAIEVVLGFAGSSLSPSLVNTSNNEYLVLYGEDQPEYDKVEVIFEVPILPDAPLLRSVVVELKSDFCTRLAASLGGGAAQPDQYFDLGLTDLCLHSEGKVTFNIPDSIAEEDLGFSAGSPIPLEPLRVLLTMEIHGQPGCIQGLCVSTGEDEEIDEIMVNTEYP